MKLISFQHNNGQDSYGAVLGDRVVDLREVFGARAPDLKALIAAGLLGEAAAALELGRRHAGAGGGAPAAGDPQPRQDRLRGPELRRPRAGDRPRGHREADPVPARAESQVAHGEDIVLPPESSRLDYEGEIAVVIGQGGRRIAEADAWEHIAGYACYNDGSIRDWQTATPQWTAGKNFWRTGGFGPWMVTRDEIRGRPDHDAGDAPERRGNAAHHHRHADPQHPAPDRLHLDLHAAGAGDVIVTGTPGGVGAKRNPPVWMKAGDVVEVEVDAIGVLRNGIRAE